MNLSAGVFQGFGYSKAQLLFKNSCFPKRLSVITPSPINFIMNVKFQISKEMKSVTMVPILCVIHSHYTQYLFIVKTLQYTAMTTITYLSWPLGPLVSCILNDLEL